jgi:hypothetical protein
VRKLVVLGGVAVLAALPPAAASPARDPSVLAIDGRTPGRERLVNVDPLTLRPRGTRGVDLAEHGFPYAFSADRSRLVLSRWEPPSLRIVDARRLRVLRTVPLGGNRRVEVQAVAWLAGRIVVLLERSSGEFAVLRVDPAEGRVVAAVAIRRWPAEVAATQNRLVVLLRPGGRIGSARLLVVTPERVRTVTLAGIRAGLVPAREGKPYTTVIPGLAVSRRVARAWVIGARRSAEVDLRTLAVRYHGEPRHLSLQKVPLVGSARDVQWLPSGELVVTGWDAVRNEQGEIVSIPSGLRLLEPRRWTDRLIHPRAPLFYVRSNQLLTIGPGEPECATLMLTAYTLAGSELYRVCEDRSTGAVEFAGRYVRLGRVDRRVAIVDLDSGAVVARTRDTRVGPLESSLIEEF